MRAQSNEQQHLRRERQEDVHERLDADVPAVELRERKHQRARHEAAMGLLLRPKIAKTQRAVVQRENQRRPRPLIEHRHVDDETGDERKHCRGEEPRPESRHTRVLETSASASRLRPASIISLFS